MSRLLMISFSLSQSGIKARSGLDMFMEARAQGNARAMAVQSGTTAQRPAPSPEPEDFEKNCIRELKHFFLK
jgi:hypothetical protein